MTLAKDMPKGQGYDTFKVQASLMTIIIIVPWYKNKIVQSEASALSYLEFSLHKYILSNKIFLSSEDHLQLI
jgi:hypothetical protein